MAQADSRRCIANAPYRAVVAIRDTSGALVTGATGLDSELIVDSAAPSDLTSEAVEIGTSGIYYVDITAAELDAAGDATLLVKSSEGVTTSLLLPLETGSDSGVAQSATASSVTIRSTASSTDDYYVGQQIEIVRGTGSGQVRTIIDYTGSTTTVDVDHNWTTNPDSTSVYIILPRTGARMGTNAMTQVDIQEVDADNTIPVAMQYAYQGGFVQSSVDDATPSTTSFDGASGLSTTDDFYNNAILIFVTGNLASVAREITDYDGSNLTLTVAAFPVSPANGDKFIIIGKVF